MKDVLKAFGFGAIQDAATLLRVVRRAGHSTDEFLAFVESEKERRIHDLEAMRERIARVEQQMARCPDCGIPMVLRDAKDGGSHWTCPKCRFGQYDPRPINEIEAEIRQKTEEETP